MYACFSNGLCAFIGNYKECIIWREKAKIRHLYVTLSKMYINKNPKYNCNSLKCLSLTIKDVYMRTMCGFCFSYQNKMNKYLEYYGFVIPQMYKQYININKSCSDIINIEKEMLQFMKKADMNIYINNPRQ